MRGSNFRYSSSEIGGGSHVMHMQVVSLLIHQNVLTYFNLFEFRFWSSTNKCKWTKSRMRRVHDHVIDKLYEISFLIHFHLFKLNQKRDFEQFESVPKAGFIQIDVMRSFISKREIRVDQKYETVCICVTGLPPPISELTENWTTAYYCMKTATEIPLRNLFNWIVFFNF